MYARRVARGSCECMLRHRGHPPSHGEGYYSPLGGRRLPNEWGFRRIPAAQGGADYPLHAGELFYLITDVVA